MGFPIRANIFRSGSKPQRYFRRFPIQVAVLFSPTDDDFAPVFRNIFLHLDQLTGDRVAFFAVLDPPEDWREAARNRPWWREQRERVGELGFSFDERPLVAEIGRRFSVEWYEMPVIVVSPYLWAAEYIVAPTSGQDIERQLSALTDLARAWGRPDINQIIDLFENDLGASVRYIPPSPPQQSSLNEFYDVLDNYDPHNNRIRNKSTFDRQLRQASRGARGRTNAIAASRSRDDSPDYQDDNILFEQVTIETAGRMVPIATVAERVFQRLTRSVRYRDALYALDEPSLAMVETSFLVGRFLEALDSGAIPGVPPMPYGDRRHPLGGNYIDYSPGAMGIWKMLELETNLSLIQAARFAFGIFMPDFFMLHEPDFPAQGASVLTGTRKNGDPIRVNLNQRDRRHKPRHTLITLGTGWHVVNTLQGQTKPDFDGVISDILGTSLPKIVMEHWKALRPIRNKASHVEPISREDYQKVLSMGLHYQFLDPLMRIKCALRR